MSNKELQQEIYQYAERREYANNDIDYVVPMSDMPEIIALVRKDEKQRCIDIALSVKTNSRAPGFNNGWEHCQQKIAKAIKEGQE